MYEQKGFLDKVKSFDVYKKLPKGSLQPTFIGACLTVITFILGIYLFLFEFQKYFLLTTKSEMLVDLSNGSEKILINLDITLPSLPCSLISLDIADNMGSHSWNVGGKLVKLEIHKNANAFNATKNVEDINNQTYQYIPDRNKLYNKAKEDIINGVGCKLIGKFDVLRVPGNFHISSHGLADIVNRLKSENKTFFLNLSHTINRLAFGDEEIVEKIKDEFTTTGLLNPLDGVMKTDDQSDKIFEYYLNIVPTQYVSITEETYNSYQFTANSYIDKHITVLPAIFFRLNTSPILVKYSKIQPNVFNALIDVCAIFGGMITIAGILDSFLLRIIGDGVKRK